MGTWQGEMSAFAGRSVRRRALTLWLVMAVLVAACGDDDDPAASPAAGSAADNTTEASEAVLQPCAEDRHLVAVDITGTVTAEDARALGPWLSDGVEPTARPGAAAVFQAYRDRGYELMYVSLLPPDAVQDLSVEELFTSWLANHDFPTGPGAEVWSWDGTGASEGRTWVVITDRLLALAAEGVSVDAGYTESPEYSHAFAAGGVPADRNYSLTPVVFTEETLPPTPTVRIADDMSAHAGEVQELAPVCQVG